jgi:hypothetical protein
MDLKQFSKLVPCARPLRKSSALPPYATRGKVVDHVSPSLYITPYMLKWTEDDDTAVLILGEMPFVSGMEAEYMLHRVRGHDFNEGTCKFEVQYFVRDSCGAWIPYKEHGMDHWQWEPISCFVFEDGSINDHIQHYCFDHVDDFINAQLVLLERLGVCLMY